MRVLLLPLLLLLLLLLPLLPVLVVGESGAAVTTRAEGGTASPAKGRMCSCSRWVDLLGVGKGVDE